MEDFQPKEESTYAGALHKPLLHLGDSDKSAAYTLRVAKVARQPIASGAPAVPIAASAHASRATFKKSENRRITTFAALLDALDRPSLSIFGLQRITTEILRYHEDDQYRKKTAMGCVATDTEQSAAFGRSVKTPKKPSPKTAKQHIKGAKCIILGALKACRPVWDQVIEKSSTGSSYYRAKAQLQFGLVRAIRICKKTLDNVATSEPRDVRRAMRYLPMLTSALASIPKGKPEKFKRKPGKKRVNKSKSRSLANAPADWEKLLLQAVPSKWRRYLELMELTGCRPQEALNGIDVTHKLNGELEIIIHGAKISENSGHQRRSLTFSSCSHPTVGQFLNSIMPGQTQFNSLKSVVKSDGLPYADVVDAFRKAISRCSRKLFPEVDVEQVLTAYSLRHNFKASMKLADMSEEKIALSMGHRSTGSQVYYGRNTKRGSAVAPVAVAGDGKVKVRCKKFVERKRAEAASARSKVGAAVVDNVHSTGESSSAPDLKPVVDVPRGPGMRKPGLR